MSRRRVAGVAVLVLLALAAATLVALPEIARRVVVWQLAAKTRRPVSLAAVDLDLLGGRLGLRDLRVSDRDGGPLVRIERLEVRLIPRDLLRGHVRIAGAALHAPAVRIVRTGPGEFNVSDLLGGPPGGGLALGLTVERAELRSGTVSIEDRTLEPPRIWRIDGVTLDVQSVSTAPDAPPGVVTLAAVAAGSPISVWASGVRLSPLRFHATAIAREIEASLAALYLPPGSPLSPVRGRLHASASVERDGDAGTRLSLDAVFQDIELRQPGREGASLAAPAVRVTVEDLRAGGDGIALGRLAVDGGTAVLEDARLAPVRRWQADGIALEARRLSSARDAPGGTAVAKAVIGGAPVSVWVADLRLAPLAMDVTAIARDVDLALFRLYLPPDLPVQPERGIVNATVRVDHDAAGGTRLALDARLAGVELRRPAHFVTAPAIDVKAEEIAFGAGAVTVGRLAVGGARLTLEDRTLTPPRTWAVQDLAVEATRLSSRREDVQGVATARATVAGASVSAWVTHVRLDPLELRATAIVRDLDLPLVQLYLPEAVPVQLGRGAVNATAQLDHDRAAGTRLTGDLTVTGVEARGRDAAAGLAASARSLRVALAGGRWHEAALEVGRLEVAGSASLVDARALPATAQARRPDGPMPLAQSATPVSPGGRAAPVRVDLEQLRLAGEGLTWPARGPARVELGVRLRDGGEVEASGAALLTAPPPMIAWTAELAVRVRALDLAPVATYVPAASGLGGRANGSVTVNVAQGAALVARVQGDVGATGVALTERGRTLLSLPRLDATGVDLVWPERIAARHVRLDRPQALVERDRQGAFPLLDRFAPRPAAAPDAAGRATHAGGSTGQSDRPGPETARGANFPPAGATAEIAHRASPAIALGEVVVERGRVTYVDASEGAPRRLDVPRLDLTLREATWPGPAPAQLRLDAVLPEGGTVAVEGSVSAEPLAVDLKLALADAALALAQPYAPFNAAIGGRLDANVALAGPLSPALRLTARGDATLRGASLSDGRRPAVTIDRLEATGIDVAWPGRVTVDRMAVRRSWALIERDREGRFLLRTLLQNPPGTAPAPPPGPAPAGPTFEFHLREALFEDGAARIVDAVTTPPARFEIAGTRLAVQDLSWPPRGPVKLRLSSPTPVGGRLDVDATLELEPARLEGRARLEDVELAPAQPYLPIEGRIAGRASGDVSLKLATDPLVVQLTGQAGVQAFRLSDGDRPLVAAGRMDALGIEVDWPRRIAIEKLELRRPSLLIERDARGEIALPRLVTPRWRPAAPAGTSASPVGPSPERAAPTPGRGVPPPAAGPDRPPTSPGGVPPVIEIATVRLERASGRFVDQTTRPPYAEQLSRIDLTLTGLTTAPGGRAQFAGSGALGGGATFKLEGAAAAGDPPTLEVKVDVQNYAIARANPYLERFTAWTATRGTLTAAATYTVTGTHIDASHDIVVRGLEVEQPGAADEVARRLGLPLGFLVALLKDARGELRLSLPVSGDLATREFDFQDAVWSAVRALAIRLLALPFARVGSLFFTPDSKVEGVALAPALFQPGVPALAPAMTDHLDRVATFLRESPSVGVRLVPILTQADLDVLKRERVIARLGVAPSLRGVPAEAAQRAFRERWPDRPLPTTVDAVVAELATGEPVPEDAMRELGARRLDAVRQELAVRGIAVDRLRGSTRRVPLVEAAGSARVELDLRP